MQPAVFGCRWLLDGFLGGLQLKAGRLQFLSGVGNRLGKFRISLGTIRSECLGTLLCVLGQKAGFGSFTDGPRALRALREDRQLVVACFVGAAHLRCSVSGGRLKESPGVSGPGGLV